METQHSHSGGASHLVTTLPMMEEAVKHDVFLGSSFNMAIARKRVQEPRNASNVNRLFSLCILHR